MKVIIWGTLLLLAPCCLAETRALVVAGLGGEPGYEAEFQRWARAGAEGLARVSPDVTLLLGETLDRDRLRAAFEALAERSDPADAVVVLLIGHGSYDDRDFRFNIPGADATGDDLMEWLQALPKRQLVVVATSASGALTPLLGREGRMLVTATRSGGENNATVFPRYFTGALQDPAADVDKDGRVSAGEAFRFAANEVAEHYRSRGEMAVEHAVVEGPELRLTLTRLADQPAFATRNAAERQRLSALEADIAALRSDKNNREPDAYYAELQRLLLELALLRRQLSGEAAP